MTWESTHLVEVAQGDDLRVYTSRDQLTVVLQDMLENDYSQVIVRVSGRIAFVTVEGITRWLAQWAEHGKVTLTGVELHEVLELEHEDNLLVLSVEQTVHDAKEAFESAVREGRPRLFAIVVTETGDPTDKPIGIVTPENLVE